MNMNSKQIGNITEFECMLAFMKAGYNVLTPYGDCERYDFVADVNGKLIKIQCKTSRLTSDGSSFMFECRSNHRVNGKCVYERYTSDEIDYFATTYGGKCYLISQSECATSKRLRLIPTANNQTIGVSFAKDYELEVIMKAI